MPKPVATDGDSERRAIFIASLAIAASAVNHMVVYRREARRRSLILKQAQTLCHLTQSLRSGRVHVRYAPYRAHADVSAGKRVVCLCLRSPSISFSAIWTSKTSLISTSICTTAATRRFRVAVTERTPADIVQTVKDAGLRGRGGAGFPTGVKWGFLPKGVYPRYLLCNCDESEPGTFNNHQIIDRNPHQLIEGIAIFRLCDRSQPGVHLHPRRVCRRSAPPGTRHCAGV